MSPPDSATDRARVTNALPRSLRGPGSPGARSTAFCSQRERLVQRRARVDAVRRLPGRAQPVADAQVAGAAQVARVDLDRLARVLSPTGRARRADPRRAARSGSPSSGGCSRACRARRRCPGRPRGPARRCAAGLGEERRQVGALVELALHALDAGLAQPLARGGVAARVVGGGRVGGDGLLHRRGRAGGVARLVLLAAHERVHVALEQPRLVQPGRAGPARPPRAERLRRSASRRTRAAPRRTRAPPGRCRRSGAGRTSRGRGTSPGSRGGAPRAAPCCRCRRPSPARAGRARPARGPARRPRRACGTRCPRRAPGARAPPRDRPAPADPAPSA